MRVIRHTGTVTVCAGAEVARIEAGHVIVAARARVGRIRCKGDVVVQAGAVVGDLKAMGDAVLLGDCQVDRVVVAGDVVVVGAPKIGSLRHEGRLTTRDW